MAALGAEFRRMSGILGLPAALAAFVPQCRFGLFGAALGAELALVDLAASRAGPAVLGLFGAAVGAELAEGLLAAGGADPAVSLGRCRRGGGRFDQK